MTKLYAVAVLLFCAMPAHAEPAFPSRPMTIVVPFAAGGPSDAMARIIAQAMGEKASTIDYQYRLEFDKQLSIAGMVDTRK